MSASFRNDLFPIRLSKGKPSVISRVHVYRSGALAAIDFVTLCMNRGLC